MKCKIPEISWHNRDPVLSVDIQPKVSASNSYFRLASGGTDAHVLIWYMKLTSSGEYGDIALDLAADLARHQKAVNVVKWSPSGELLASGDDESVVFIWKQKCDSEPLNILDSANEQDKEVWITMKVLRGHMEDIYDLSWAPNSLYLVSGSVDNSAMIWDVQKGKSMSILNDHKGFVQGVAWDPKNQYVATLSTDRYLRIFDIQTKKVLYRVSKSTLPVPEDNPLHGKRMRLFHDDTLQTFFRRLTFTPDGKLLLTPAGVSDYDGCTRPLNNTYIFSRYGFRQPAIVLPCPDQYTVAVKCCPLLYKLRPYNPEKNPPVVPLPYRMIFAVATKSSVYFYDTQQKQPFALISNIHYTRLTDITWSNDGRIVVVSSTDGFCSLITFEKGELGEEYEKSEAVLEAVLAQAPRKTKKQKESEMSAKSRKPSTDDNVGAQKDPTNVQKEMQLEKIVEKESDVKHLDTKFKPDSAEKTNNSASTDTDNIQTVSLFIEESKAVDDQKEPSILGIKFKSVDQKQSTDERNENEPIGTAFRKPGSTKTEFKADAKNHETNVLLEVISNIAKTKADEKAAHIDIKQKLGQYANIDGKNEACAKSDEVSTPPKTTSILSSKVLPADIILDKEILSSDEKFESPEKKSRSATPITVRRHPRTPSSVPQTPTSMTNILKPVVESTNCSPISSLSKEKVTALQDRKAKPIAVRRTPRSIISTPSVVNTTSLVEEAMDAWPLEKVSDEINDKETPSEFIKEPIKEPGVTPLAFSETTCERTEDIRLVYEETIEEAPLKEASTESLDIENSSREDRSKTLTPSSNRTPRRVALKTISTPKSKKKLVD